VFKNVVYIGVRSLRSGWLVLSAVMSNKVARSAHRYQILFGIIARVATKLFVVDLQVRHRSARLTAPAITPEVNRSLDKLRQRCMEHDGWAAEYENKQQATPLP
jgi:hypothetical protein